MIALIKSMIDWQMRGLLNYSVRVSELQTELYMLRSFVYIYNLLDFPFTAVQELLLSMHCNTVSVFTKLSAKLRFILQFVSRI